VKQVELHEHGRRVFKKYRSGADLTSQVRSAEVVRHNNKSATQRSLTVAVGKSGPNGGNIMKTWTKPEVREQEVGLEVTSYLPAEIDII